MGSVVVDVGGTTMRLAHFDQGSITQVRRVPVANFERNPDLHGEALYRAFLDQLNDEISGLLADHPAAPVGLAFPGPVEPQGTAMSAPTLWADRVGPVPLQADLARALGRTVHVQNDISAAAWRYAAEEDEDFCLITVSSGIGNKVFRKGEVLLNRDGLGGEIGHCQVADGIDALPCDCGGTGHLGGIASGRGTLRLAQRYADLHPELLARSPLVDRPVAEWTTFDLVAALAQDDAFAWRVCEAAQGYLVVAMRHLYHWIGVRRFIFIGGFATAIGTPYIERLNRLLAREMWFGMSADDMQQMCRLGAADDDHSLIGMGLYLAAQEPR